MKLNRFLYFSLLVFVACAQAPVEDLHIVPQPVSVILKDGSVCLSGRNVWVDPALGPEAEQAVSERLCVDVWLLTDILYM